MEILEDRVLARPIFTQSGIMSSFSKADGYIRIERNLEGLREGDRVFVYRF
jgi:molybdopterin molybdotransferase